MRHAISTTIEIDASPQSVWEVLIDLDRFGEWNPFITSASGEVEVGERLVNRIEPPGARAMTFKPTVTVVDEGRVFEWLGRAGVPGIFDGRHRFELTQTPSGDTQLVHSEIFSGLLVRVLRGSLDDNTKAGFEAMNVALKQRVEASEPA